MELQNERSKFTYLQWQKLYETQKPFQIFINIPENLTQIQQTNLVFKQGREEVIHNIRGNEQSYQLDEHGFMLCNHRTDIKNWTDSQEIETKYLPEIETLLRKEIDEVDRVFFFDWRVSSTNYELNSL